MRDQLIPNHVAIIMDGNGRWARDRRRPRVWGHRLGAKRVRDIVKASWNEGVKVLTLFAFSEENWGRPQPEVNALMTLMERYVRRELADLVRDRVRLRTIGDLSRLPVTFRGALLEAQEKTRSNDGLILNIAVNYSGRSDIVRAAQRLALRVAKGDLSPSQIDQELFGSALDTGGLPDPDLIIRTSGEVRVSNFLLWECAYAEFVFSTVQWPDFTPQELKSCLAEYQRRNRRFGLVAPPSDETSEVVILDSEEDSSDAEIVRSANSPGGPHNYA